MLLVRLSFVCLVLLPFGFVGCSRSSVTDHAAHQVSDGSTQNQPHSEHEQVHHTPAADATAQPSGDPRTETTIRMAQLLRELNENADPEGNPSTSPKALIKEYRQKIDRELRLKQQFLLRAHLGWQLLLDGQSETALVELDAVRRNMDLTGERPDSSFAWNLRELIAIGNLRLAEQKNCIGRHNCESCILPIQGEGIHEFREGATSARDEFARGLEQRPDDMRSRWLLNLAYMTLGEYPDKVPSQWLIPASAFESDYDIKRFTDVASGAGVDTISLSGGVIMDDFNRDGLLDLMITDWGVDQQTRLHINKGDGTFVERTREAGLEGEVGGLNLVQTDYDNDGHIDVLILRGAWVQDHGQYPNSLLRNLGDGRFDDVTEKAGIFSKCPTQTGVWADFDLDGWLDLFVGNETFQSKDYPCEFYRNNHDGTFTNIAVAAGVAHVGRVKGASAGDYDNDGRPDLYLSNFGEDNILFRNITEPGGEIRFEDVTAQAGVAAPKGSFPTWFFDYDNDGWLDILAAPYSGFKFDGEALATVVAEYLGQPAPADKVTLYRNNGDGTFESVANKLNFDAPLLAMGSNFGDLDNDGYLDCYFGTGDPHFSTLVPNRMFRNAKGRQFQDVTTSGGFGHVQKGHGIAFGDLDNDGDQDIYAVMGGAIAGDVYQNVLFENPGHGNHWITLRCEGKQANRAAIGTRIKITVKTSDGSRAIYASVNSGGSFGASSLQQEIGLGNATAIESIEIRWPGAKQLQTFQDVPLDKVYHVRQGDEALVPVDVNSFTFPRAHAGHTHHSAP